MGVPRIACLVLALFLTGAVPAAAQSTTTRVDLFKTNGQRDGGIILNESTGRIDVYDRDSNRTGYGYVSPSGKLDLYDLRGNRSGSGILTPGGAVRQEQQRRP